MSKPTQKEENGEMLRFASAARIKGNPLRTQNETRARGTVPHVFPLQSLSTNRDVAQVRQHLKAPYLPSLWIGDAGEPQVALLPVGVDAVALKLPQLKRSMKGLGVNLDSDGIDNNKHPLHDLFSKAVFAAKRKSFKSSGRERSTCGTTQSRTPEVSG